MNIQELAKKIALTQKYIKAYKYDLYYRDFDDRVELLALVDDPNYDMKNFERREMLFPKKWVTLTTLDPETQIKV